VIGEEGEQLGVLDIRDAIRQAREKGLDLVEVAATADPPVCRIIDFGKFQYEAKKKANEAKKKQVTITVKEVKFRPGTDDHDYDYRMKHAREWLEGGDKVKATIWFRGREMTHRELGARILEKLEKDLIEVGEVEARPRMEGNQMFIILGPKRHKGTHATPPSTTATAPRPASGPTTQAAPLPKPAPPAQASSQPPAGQVSSPAPAAPPATTPTTPSTVLPAPAPVAAATTADTAPKPEASSEAPTAPLPAVGPKDDGQ
jgi:translation initiation factor IF-3